MTSMNYIVRIRFRRSLYDAIGVGILGAVVGSMLAIVGETTTAGLLLSAVVGSGIGATVGAALGLILRGYGGVILGLIGGAMLGISAGDFKWVIPGVVAGPIIGALAGPLARTAVETIRGSLKGSSGRRD